MTKIAKQEPRFSPKEIDSIVTSEMSGLSRMRLHSEKRRIALDSLLEIYPDIAEFYQQRAMPLYKQNKDELGLPFLEKAVALNPQKYIDYMAFMKCIFSKEYRSAIIDLEKALAINGPAYVMDHTYYFYLGLSYLQLNEFDIAIKNFELSIAQMEAEHGREWVHFLDLMYLGIAYMEKEDYDKAIEAFNESLVTHKELGDVKFYLSKCLIRSGKIEEGKAMYLEAKEDFINGNTINEDNVIYEEYPYQVRSVWFGIR